jgi:hypothetical protein
VSDIPHSLVIPFPRVVLIDRSIGHQLPAKIRTSRPETKVKIPSLERAVLGDPPSRLLLDSLADLFCFFGGWASNPEDSRVFCIDPYFYLC